MAFDIRDYLEKNKIELGSVEKEVGTTISKSGHNDLRKTSYDVNIVDGKLDLYTHKKVIVEAKVNKVKPSAYKFQIILTIGDGESMEVAKFIAKGDAVIAMGALNKSSNNEYKYSIVQ
jgi:hypothetical protein